jgi:hypothetical protein
MTAGGENPALVGAGSYYVYKILLSIFVTLRRPRATSSP